MPTKRRTDTQENTTSPTTETTQQQTQQTQETQTNQIVDDWTDDTQQTQQTERQRSVTQFDRSEVAKLESSTVSSLTTEQLLMLVIRRGEEEKNPVLSGGCERVLRQINRERIARPRFTGPRFKDQTATRGSYPFGRGGTRPQGTRRFYNRDGRNTRTEQTTSTATT